MSQKEFNFDDFKIENILDPSLENEIDENEENENHLEEEKEEEEETAVEVKDTEKETTKEKVETKEKDEKPTDENEEDDDGENDSPDFSPFMEALHEKFGWEFDEETLEENSLDGVVNHLSSIVKTNVEALLDEELSVGDGTLKKLHEFVKNGGDPKRFMEVYYNPIDYAEIDLEDENIQERAVRDLLEKQGYDAEEINDKLDNYKDSGILEKEAKMAKKKLSFLQEKDKETLLERQKEEIKAKEIQENEYWNEVKSTINKWDKIGDFPIAEKDKNTFFDYLNKKDREGLTAYQKDLMGDKAAAIKMAYIQFKKFNIEDVKKSVKTEVTKKVKESITKFNSSNKSGKSKQVDEESANSYNKFKLPWA